MNTATTINAGRSGTTQCDTATPRGIATSEAGRAFALPHTLGCRLATDRPLTILASFEASRHGDVLRRHSNAIRLIQTVDSPVSAQVLARIAEIRSWELGYEVLVSDV